MCLCVVMFINAQSLCSVKGVLINEQTKTPLFGVTVQIIGTSISKITDSKGVFILEKSIDGKNFVELATIAGAGTSAQVLNYVYRDEAPSNGITYYRLSQQDFDGEISESGNVIGTTSKSRVTLLGEYGACNFRLATLSRFSESFPPKLGGKTFIL